MRDIVSQYIASHPNLYAEQYIASHPNLYAEVQYIVCRLIAS